MSELCGGTELTNLSMQRRRGNDFCAEKIQKQERPCTTRKALSYGQDFQSQYLIIGPNHDAQIINTHIHPL